MLASRFLLNSYICSIQDTRNAHNKSPEQNNAMDTKNPLDFWYPSALLHKDLKCKAPLIELNLRRNLGKWST